VIEAHELPPMSMANAHAKIVVQGPTTLSAAKTRSTNSTLEPFWNEKFVFGVEEDHKDSTFICAELFSMLDEHNAVKMGAIRPIPVTTLLSGQKMSLPTIIQGNHIYCIDGWFDLTTEVPATLQPFVIGLSRTKVPGKCQVHLRITFIPSPGTAQLPMLGFKKCHVFANKQIR